jgi:phosphotransferase system enzyme I (PtsP)
MERQQIGLLADIGTIIAGSKEPGEALEEIVQLVAKRCGVDVCSVYLLDENETILELKATTGLSPDSVGTIRMKKDEGLTGLVLEKGAPLFVVDPSVHPRYKYFEGSGEETYQTFMGLPLTFQRRVLGVLVVQTLKRDAVSEQDIPVFSTIAVQMAALLAYSGVWKLALQGRARIENKDAIFRPGRKKERGRGDRRGMVRGTGASPGFGEGFARYLAGSIGFEQIHRERVTNIANELERLDRAFVAAEKELTDLMDDEKGLAHEGRAIMDAHGMFLRDKSFRKKIYSHVNKGTCAEHALKQVVSDYMERFLGMDDPYWRDRSADIEHVGKQVLRRLLGIEESLWRDFQKPTIIIATDISPVDLVRLRQRYLKGIVLSRGGKTSHTVILAKSFELPMVIGATEVFERVYENDFVIADGTSGLVFDDPPGVILEEYKRLREENANEFLRLDVLRDRKAKTQDGQEIKLGANIGLLSDLDLVKKYGADHIGLYRTEFPFLARKDFPSGEEQQILYEKIVRGAGACSVTIRTLDVGGDKFLSYLDYPKEQNPYLGWRSIRVSLDLDDMFRTQLRAILSASAVGRVRVLFPMITSVDEIRKVMGILEEEKQALRTRGISFDEKMPAGLMVEVPAAAKILKSLLPYVNFVSIGTNDLVQYLLAVDRNNEKVADIYSPLHPAVITTIAEVVHTCKAFGKSISICGESASDPRCVLLFLAMGVDRLSMNPASVPLIKDFLRRISFDEAKSHLLKVLAMEDTDTIQAYLNQATEKKRD